jgi:hypothetical protein
VVRNRPVDLVDGCWNGGTRVNEPAVYQGSGQCDTLYPSFGDTRIAAGAPLRDDILKCELKPLDFASYPVSFTDEQRARLSSTFPDGVCDYTRRGAGQVPANGVWQPF